MSEHKAEVVEVKLEKHPNADLLSIARVRGWQCVVKTEDFKGAMLGVYIPIDMVVPDTPEWAWLSERRVKTHKFRGAISQGLLIPAEKGMKLGDDVTEDLGITRYVPQLPGNKSKLRGGYSIAPPPGMIKYTDIENWKNYTDVFNEGEVVVVSEKIHGANARFALLDGKFYVGSHNAVKKPIPPEPTGFWSKKWIKFKRKCNLEPPQRFPDVWQQVADKYEVEQKMRHTFGNYRDVILFGEIYGPKVQPLDYGVPSGETKVAFFDIYVNGAFTNWPEMKNVLAQMGLPMVPEIKVTRFGPEVFQMVDGPAFAGKHIREGIVVRPWPSEEFHPKLGRKIIKLISEKYLLKDYVEIPEE
jgi:RNA ligase (TIGR02306 family)